MSKKNPYEKRRPLSDEEANQQAQLFFDSYYEDRGMLKWQGYFLSDHTSALNKQKAEESLVIKRQPQQTESELGEIMQDAWQYHKQVILQINTLDSNQQPQEYTGYIAGHTGDDIVFQDVAGKNQTINIEEIRNIRPH